MERVQRPKIDKNKSIGRKIGYVAALMQVVSVVFAMTVCVFMFKSLITKMQEERCTNGTNILSKELGRVSGTEDMNEVLDDLKNRMGCEFTIFEGDTRAYSTVTKNGERVVGTQLSSELKSVVLDQGKSYVGKADILGIDYLCSYVPTKGDDGKIDGLIFAGISMEEVKKETFSVIVIGVVISLIVIVICGLFLLRYLKKSVSMPMGEITHVAERLEKGDLGLGNGETVQVGVRSNDEIGKLGQNFEGTIRCLRSYIGEITDVLNAIANGDLTESATQDYMGDFQSIKRSLDSIQDQLNNTTGQIGRAHV